MSKMEKVEVSCPKCNNNQSVIVWQSLNVTLTPELGNKLLNGEINTFRCETCNIEIFIDSPLLYHDMNKKYCVQYFPQKKIEDSAFYNIFTIDGKLSGLPNNICLSEPHIVFDIIEMIRYIKFRDKLYNNYI